MKRICYADGLRICAAFMVILLHVSAQYWSTTAVDSVEWKTFNFYDSFARPAVPIFVMISGMFLLDPQRTVTLRAIFSKYCKRIVLIWVVWSAFYATWHDVFWNLYQHREIYWENVLQAFLTGHYHLWYCKMLLGLYLVLPFLREVAANKKLTEYFLILTVCFTVILPYLPWQWLKTVQENSYFYFTYGFVGYFLLGYYLRQTLLPKIIQYVIYLLGIAGLLWTVLASQEKSISLNAAFGYYDPWMPNIVFMTVAVFVFFQYMVNPLLEQQTVLLQTGSKYMLGVYLVHPFVMTFLGKMGFSILSFPVYLSVPLFSALVFLISYGCSYLMEKIPFLGKLLC